VAEGVTNSPVTRSLRGTRRPADPVDPVRDHVAARMRAVSLSSRNGDFECPDCGKRSRSYATFSDFGDLAMCGGTCTLTTGTRTKRCRRSDRRRLAAQGKLLGDARHPLRPSGRAHRQRTGQYADQLDLKRRTLRDDRTGLRTATASSPTWRVQTLSGARGTPTFSVNGQRHHLRVRF